MRIVLFVLVFFCGTASALAQSSQEIGQMRLYIQQLEERLRQVTGQNEQLMYELQQLRAQTGQAAPLAATQAGAAPAQPLPGATAGMQAGSGPAAIPAQQDPSSMSVAQDDPLIAPDGFDFDTPVDLSEMAGGQSGASASGTGLAPTQPGNTQTAALPSAPGRPTALSGTARDEYDLAYGYVLTGDYGLAEQSFQNWLAAFPEDPQAADARFWLGESHYQQGEYREAANQFLAVYKSAPESAKGPDALLKLGVALSALGERNAGCATLAEVERKYPQASPALMSRVAEEETNAGC